MRNHGLDTDEMVCFYEQEFYVLSNFSAFNLECGPITFQTSEHAYQFEKFAGRSHVCVEIKEAKSAHDAFILAQKYKHMRRPNWDDVKVNIMLRLLRLKAEQHEYVRRKLLETGDRRLVENSWRDDYWGWGPNKDGLNMLGELWMQVRSEIRAKQ